MVCFVFTSSENARIPAHFLMSPVSGKGMKLSTKFGPTPHSWLSLRRIAWSVVRPVEAFIKVEASSGILLLITAIVALIWANSPWSHSYEELWHTNFVVGLGPWQLDRSLHFWINDFLMAFFFMLVGVEIKREIVEGALSEIRRAALPLAAALGGMLVPAAIYVAINLGNPETIHGWGVPMATDIAFAVGVLTLLGNRVPPGVRVLLLALAIVDDIGAILVIAIFYTPGFDISGLVLAAGGIAAIWGLFYVGVRPGPVLFFPAFIVWLGFLQSGIHPTIAGVIVGLLVPVRPWLSRDRFLELANSALDEFKDGHDKGLHDHELIAPLHKLSRARKEAVSPTVRIEKVMHPWIAYGIMPIFALANAGVRIDGIDLGDASALVAFSGVAIGLSLGKPLGVLLFSWLAVKLKLCVLPAGMSWKEVGVVGTVAGIGFTMAIFITELAFAGSEMLGVAKFAVLVGTVVSGVAGLVLGRWILSPDGEDEDDVKISDSDVEASTEYWTTGGF